MFAWFCLLPLALGQVDHLRAAKNAIKDATWNGLLKYDDGDKQIQFSEFNSFLQATKGGTKITPNLDNFVSAISRGDGVSKAEFMSIGQGMFNDQNTATQKDPELQIKDADRDGNVDDDWLPALTKGAKGRTYEQALSHADTKKKGAEIDEVSMTIFVAQALFATMAGHERNADYTAKKNFDELKLEKGEYATAIAKVPASSGPSFVETAATMEVDVNEEGQAESLVAQLEQQLHDLDAERAEILRQIQQQKTQAPVRKGPTDTGDHKRGFREVEIRPEKIAPIIDTDSKSGVGKNAVKDA